MTNKEILLSIYPKYNNLIKNGIKNFEFRSFKLHSESGFIIMWVYETLPTKSIKYKMTVKNPISKLSENQIYGLGNDRFEKLINEGKVAYEIISFEEILTPITLEDLKKLQVSAPQNYLYTKNYTQLETLLNLVKTSKII